MNGSVKNTGCSSGGPDSHGSRGSSHSFVIPVRGDQIPSSDLMDTRRVCKKCTLIQAHSYFLKEREQKHLAVAIPTENMEYPSKTLPGHLKTITSFEDSLLFTTKGSLFKETHGVKSRSKGEIL